MNKQVFLYEDGIGSVSYIDHMGDDLTIVNSARVSFGVEKKELDKRDKRLINYLVKNRHTSTFEHNVVTFKFVVPLYVRSQHHRHRTWSYNEISRRYTEKDIKFYEPEYFRTQHESNRQASNEDDKINPSMRGEYNYTLYPVSVFTASDAIKEHHINSIGLFNKLIDRGVCREQARGVLPQNMYTEYYGTCNLSNLLKFIDLRLDSHAQWEIQKVAEACLLMAEEIWPIAVSSYRNIKYGEQKS